MDAKTEELRAAHDVLAARGLSPRGIDLFQSTGSGAARPR